MTGRTSPVLLALVFVALATAACTRGPVSPATEAPQSAPVPPEPPDPCEVFLARIQEVVNAASSRCATDEDCAMYRAGTIDCGGAVDKATAVEVERLTEEYWKLDCREPIACAPRSARAICDEGLCIEVSDREYDKVLEKRRLAEPAPSKNTQR